MRSSLEGLVEMVSLLLCSLYRSRWINGHVANYSTAGWISGAGRHINWDVHGGKLRWVGDYGVHVKGTGFLRAQPGPVMSSNPSCIAMDGLRYGAVYMYTDPPKLIRVSPSRSENNFDGFHPLIPSVLLFRPLDFGRTCQRSPRL